MNIKDLLQEMIKKNASDLFYRAGGVPHMRIDGKIVKADDKVLALEDVIHTVEEITPARLKGVLSKILDVDFAIFFEDLDRRFRVSIFMQRNSPSMVIRNVLPYARKFEELNLPTDILRKLASETRGLVLLTGAAGSGKSTTIASMIDYINENYQKHILTVEEPIEVTFKDKNSTINQRELGLDVNSYEVALRAFTLQSPDVIYIANIRDQETMSAALTAAETGVLVLSTLHTINASQTVERIINFFPPHQHEQVRIQLSSLLKGVISLRLIPLKSQAGRIPAYETMLLTPTVSRLIREGKIWEIPRYIEEGEIFGMQSFTQSLIKLVKDGHVNEEEASRFSDNKEEFVRSLRGIKKT